MPIRKKNPDEELKEWGKYVINVPEHMLFIKKRGKKETEQKLDPLTNITKNIKTRLVNGKKVRAIKIRLLPNNQEPRVIHKSDVWGDEVIGIPDEMLYMIGKNKTLERVKKTLTKTGLIARAMKKGSVILKHEKIQQNQIIIRPTKEKNIFITKRDSQTVPLKHFAEEENVKYPVVSIADFLKPENIFDFFMKNVKSDKDAKKILIQIHPDKNPDDIKLATENFKIFNNFLDRVKKQNYDYNTLKQVLNDDNDDNNEDQDLTPRKWFTILMSFLKKIIVDLTKYDGYYKTEEDDDNMENMMIKVFSFKQMGEKKNYISELPMKDRQKITDAVSIAKNLFDKTKSYKKWVKKQNPKPKQEEKKENEPVIIMRQGSKWWFYGVFGINETAYQSYNDYIKTVFASPKKKIPDAEWAEIQRLRQNFFNNQTASDYYPTPKIVVNRIMKHITDSDYLQRLLKSEYDKVHLLEPSAGTGSIIKGYIENFGFDTEKITANEFRKDHILTKLLSGVNIKTGDFLKMPTKEDYQLIIMNPPFNKKGHKDYYMEHVVHALNMLDRGGVMYVICPEFHDPKNEHRKKTSVTDENKELKTIFISESLENSKIMSQPMIKRLIDNGDVESYEMEKGKYVDVTLRSHQISLLGYTMDEFKTINHNKKRDVYDLKSLSMKIALYQIVVA